MPRLVQHDAQAPVKVADKWVCQCGLSKNQPFCDGSHQATLDEKKTQLYHYDADDNRIECTCTKGCCRLEKNSRFKLQK